MNKRTAKISTSGVVIVNMLTMATPGSTIGYLSNRWASCFTCYTFISMIFCHKRTVIYIDVDNDDDRELQILSLSLKWQRLARQRRIVCLEIKKLAVVMYRRRKRCRSDDGSRVEGVTTAAIESSDGDDEQWHQQQHHQQATSLFRLNRINCSTLQADNCCGIALVRNPYYMSTDPTYCMTSINGIDRGHLAFHRQVFAMTSLLM